MSVIHSRKVAQRMKLTKRGVYFSASAAPKENEKISGLQDIRLEHNQLEGLEKAMSCGTAPYDKIQPPAYRDYVEEFWNEPTAGGATRKPADKKAKTARGFTMFNGVIVWHESELERRTSKILQARNDTAGLESQCPVALFYDDDGEAHTHTFDFFVSLKSGREIAIIVKHEQKRDEMLDLIKRIKAGPSCHKFDDICLLTETYASRNAADNATQILMSRDFHNDADVAALWEIVSLTMGNFRFGELLRNFDDVRRRRIAIWRLIDAGKLIFNAGEKITDLSWLTKAAIH